MTWNIFTGTGTPGTTELPPAPPWRDLDRWREHRAETWKPTVNELDLINAAIVLRRPLLVSGPPGSGKSSIAYAVARELKWDPVLTWSVTSRSVRNDGLYHYDAAGRLRDVALAQHSAGAAAEDLARYLRLGPAGTALATSTKERPRVLLVDEIDKADIDFPNDLLDLLDEGRFEIPEAVRSDQTGAGIEVRSADPEGTVPIIGGRVQARAFPFVVLTSNGEREFPPAFLRRCLRLDTKLPERARLQEILTAHLKGLGGDDAKDVLDRFSQAVEANKRVAIDQLLDTAYLVAKGKLPDAETRARIVNALLRELDA